MLKLLNEICNKPLKDYSTKSVGNSIYILLDNDRRIEVLFCTNGTHEKYEGLKLKLFSKTNGELHSKVVVFRDVFDCILDLTHCNKIEKHIWRNRNEYSWYGKPTKEDIKALQKELINYIEVCK